MSDRFLSPQAAMQLMNLAESKTQPPKVILDLKAEIEGKTRVAELRATVTGEVDENLVQEIVGMKLRLDGLYGDWAEGKLS